MATLQFSVLINATKEKVWETLWNDHAYRQWTAVFQEGSYAESDWKEGSEISFLTPGGNGMYSIIEKKIPYVQMSFKHVGEINDGIKLPKEWGAIAAESYYLAESNGGTRLDVTTGSTAEFEAYLRDKFPEALKVLKQLCES